MPAHAALSSHPDATDSLNPDAPASEPTVGLIVSEMARQLAQLGDLIQRIERRQYDNTPSARCGSIGAHVRHILDHVEALLVPVQIGPPTIVDYQDRLRDTEAEHCPVAGLIRLQRLLTQVSSGEVQRSEGPIMVRQLVGETSQPHATLMDSSWEREWAFVCSHCLHHLAVVSLLADAVGVSTPDDFGVALSTLRYRQGDAMGAPESG